VAIPDKSRRSRLAGPYFDWQVSYRLGVPLIYAKGELDHDTATYLRRAIETELTSDPKTILLDFSELSYMDSGGLSLMFELVHRFEGSGWVGAVGANQGVSRLLEITGLSDHPSFRQFPDLAAVSAELHAAEPSN
jgi:anti-anti-sigma factor